MPLMLIADADADIDDTIFFSDIFMISFERRFLFVFSSP